MSGGLERARRDLQAGRPRLARERLKSLLAIWPEDEEIRRLLAEAYRRDGQPTEAGRWGFLHSGAASQHERDAFVKHVRYPRDRRIHPERMRRLLKSADPARLADSAGAALFKAVTRRPRPRLFVTLQRAVGRGHGRQP